MDPMGDDEKTPIFGGFQLYRDPVTVDFIQVVATNS